MTTTATAPASPYAPPAPHDVPAAFHALLLRHGWLLPTAVPGVAGKGARFERVLGGLDAYLEAAAAPDGAEVLRFPPVIPRALVERSGYLRSFPHLAGLVHSFAGSDADHLALVRRMDEGEPWADGIPATDVVLTPAACYPVYQYVSGALPPGGRLVDVMSYCFRREPSADPGRMQSFRMHEWVRIGTPDDVRAFRDRWLERGLALLGGLGLVVHSDVANDPFFGRTGRMLAATQREQALKFELLVTVSDPAGPTAVASCNYHQDHFGQKFAIATADGAPAHTACVGFGLERIVLGLVRQHGPELADWPAAVRAALRV
jgi:seryl-tRNA synthetase